MDHPDHALGVKPNILHGTLTALVTPFEPGGERIDFNSYDALVETQLAGGISGLVPCGTTGEAPTLSEAEQVQLVRRTVELAKGKVPVFAGTGSFSTHKSIAASKAALEAGAQGVMIVMPYYNKPSQEGMRQHVVTIARTIPTAPVIVYNIPGRSVVDLQTDTLARICDDAPNVIAIKDATGNVLRCQEMSARLGDRIAVLSGDDALTLPMMSVGAKGVISVTSNVLPAAVSRVTSLVESGDWASAKRAHLALLELHAAMFMEPNPAPAKAALVDRKVIRSADVRLPLVAATGKTVELVHGALARYEAQTR